jgi:hypothetical protein
MRISLRVLIAFLLLLLAALGAWSSTGVIREVASYQRCRVDIGLSEAHLEAAQGLVANDPGARRRALAAIRHQELRLARAKDRARQESFLYRLHMMRDN